MYQRYQLFVLLVLIIASISLPDTATAAGIVPCDGPDCSFCHLVDLGSGVINWIFGIVFVIFGVVVFMAGFGLATSGGNQSALDDAKKKLSNAVVGIIIVFAAWLMVDTLLKATLGNDGNIGVGGFGMWNDISCDIGQQNSGGEGGEGNDDGPDWDLLVAEVRDGDDIYFRFVGSNDDGEPVRVRLMSGGCDFAAGGTQIDRQNFGTSNEGVGTFRNLDDGTYNVCVYVGNPGQETLVADSGLLEVGEAWVLDVSPLRIEAGEPMRLTINGPEDTALLSFELYGQSESGGTNLIDDSITGKTQLDSPIEYDVTDDLTPGSYEWKMIAAIAAAGEIEVFSESVTVIETDPDSTWLLDPALVDPLTRQVTVSFENTDRTGGFPLVFIGWERDGGESFQPVLQGGVSEGTASFTLPADGAYTFNLYLDSRTGEPETSAVLEVGEVAE